MIWMVLPVLWNNHVFLSRPVDGTRVVGDFEILESHR